MQAYCWPGHQTQLLRALQRQQNSAQHCDTLLQTEEISIPTHSSVLAALSPYLSEKLSAVPSPPSGQKRQLRLSAVSAHALLKLVALLYSGHLEVRGHSEQREVLAAAHQLGIPNLVGWTDWSVEERCAGALEVQAGTGASKEKRFTTRSTQTDEAPGGGSGSLTSCVPARKSSSSLTCGGGQRHVSQERPPRPGIQTAGGGRSRDKQEGVAEGAARPRLRRSAAGVKNVARMRQMMESAQISIKVKLRRRTTGESWEVVNMQDTSETLQDGMTHTEYHVPDSSPLPAADRRRESEPPQDFVEETDEQMERLLEDIMVGLNILPSLQKDCKKTPTSDSGISCYPLPQSPSSCSNVPSQSLREVTPCAAAEDEAPSKAAEGPRAASASLCMDDYWLPQCLSPLGASASPVDAQTSLDKADTHIQTKTQRGPRLSEVPTSLHEGETHRQPRPEGPGRDETCGHSDPTGGPESGKVGRRRRGPNLFHRDWQLYQCYVNLSSRNLLLRHHGLCSMTLAKSPETSSRTNSAEQPRVRTRGSARKAQQLGCGAATESQRPARGKLPKGSAEGVGTENRVRHVKKVGTRGRHSNKDGIKEKMMGMETKEEQKTGNTRRNGKNKEGRRQVEKKKSKNRKETGKTNGNTNVKKEKNVENGEKNMENVRNMEVSRVEKEVLRRSSSKRKRDVSHAVPQKRRQEMEMTVQQKTAEWTPSEGWERKGGVSMVTGTGSQSVDSAGEAGNEGAGRRRQTAEDEAAGGGGSRKRPPTEACGSCEEDVDVLLCSPLRDVPTCLGHAHSEDEDEDVDEELDVTGV